MAISFDRIPVDLRTPGRYVEFDNRLAVRGLPGQPFKALLVGQKLSAGSQPKGELARVARADDAVSLFGRGSMLHRMAEAFRAQNTTTELWAVALDDSAGPVAAAGEITIGGSANDSGTLFLYIAGQRLTVAVTSGDALADIAQAVADAINAEALPVSAAVNGVTPEQVDLTARHPGEAGNDIDLRVNYFDGESLPSGLSVSFTPMAGGSANPDVADAIAAMASEWFNVIALPYTDTSNLTQIEDELDDRWGPMDPREGVAFACRVGAHADLLTFGDGRNSPHVSVIGVQGSPTPPWQWAAAVAGRVAFEARQDPARPLQTLTLDGVLAPAEADRFIREERNLLLFDGVSTFTVDADGTVRIEHLITTYQTNAAGSADPSYLDITTIYTLGFLRFSFRQRFAQKYPRHKLASDGTRFGPGQAVLTPLGAKAEAIALFREWEDAGLVENIDQFKEDLVVERNANDPNRLDFLLPPDLVNQLRVVAAKIEFRL